jgi:hypothetical protein
MRNLVRRLLISMLLLVELIIVFYSTTFLMSYLYDLESAPLAF